MTSTTPTLRSDAEIQQAVLRELKWDPRVKETDIGVIVHLGVVTLSGTVNSYAERVAANEAAHHVAGVHDVANDLVVRVPGSLTRTDTEIALAVRRALEWNVLVPHERIQSTVTDGWVTLEGTVEYWHQREDAERAVRHLTGVRGVTDQIAVHPPSVTPLNVKLDIEEALERRAERAAKRVEVKVTDGTAILSGSVRSWSEKQAVLGAARGTRGVQHVQDELLIEPEV